MKPATAALTACLTIVTPRAVTAQAVVAEASMTAGATTEDVRAGAVQGRLFGELKGIRYFGEVSSSHRTGPESDAFGGAYPYEPALALMDAYAERAVRGRSFIANVRGGRFRTPFGISGAAEHGYGGFLRAPLIRYPGYWAIANTFIEHGVNVAAGVPWLQAEYTVGTPADPGEERRRGGRDEVVRVQAYAAGLVAGISRLRTSPYQPESYAQGHAVFNGVDLRWMRAGYQIRGEWLWGRPFDRGTTEGGYLDLLVHPRPFGPVTAMARIETIDYVGSRGTQSAGRVTVGARIRLRDRVMLQASAWQQDHAMYGPVRRAGELAVTYTVRTSR